MRENLDFLVCPLPEDLQRLKHAGDFDRFFQVAALRLKDKKVPQMLKKRLEYEQLMVQDLLSEYIYTPEEALAELRQEVRDITREEMETLRDEGTLDWIYVNGQVRYKDDCVASLLKTRPDWNPRFLDQQALAAKYDNWRALDEIISRVKEQGGMRLRFRMRTTLKIRPEAQRPGETLRVHLPLPLRDAQSSPHPDILTSPGAVHIAPEGHPQRTAYFEAVCAPDLAFVTEFGYDLDAPYLVPQPDLVSPEQPSFDTQEEAPQIVFTPFLRALARELTGEETNPLKKARAFYDYITTQAVYRYVRPYRSVANIPEYFAAGQRGDCGMHALLFITLCRLSGIPARWQAGWSARPGHVYSHDWARFYIAPYGWLYADASFGGSAFREGHLDRWNFYFGNLEPWRMVSNSDFQQAFDPPFPFHRNDPYDNQSGEVCYPDRALMPHEYSVRRECLHWEELP